MTKRPAMLAAMLLAITAAAVALTACPPKHELLHQSVSDFNNNLRWKRWEEAAAYMPAGLRMAFVQSLEKDKADDRLNITDFELKDFAIDEESKHAVVRVRLCWYFNTEGVEKKGMLTQKWERMEDNKWGLISMEGEGPWKPEALEPIDIFGDGGKDGGRDGGDGGATDGASADR